MSGSVAAARAMLTAYGNDLWHLRTQHDIVLLRVARDTGIPTSYLSMIERGLRCPTPAETLALEDWSRQYRHIEDGPAGSGHARMGDPVSSDMAVKSIDGDQSYKTLIRRYAADVWPEPFDDTDLTAYCRKIRGPWVQRNVVARARIRLECTETVFERAGCFVSPARGGSRPTVHFIATQPTQETTR